jgi:TPR repeat protein
MRNLTATICLTVAVLLGSGGVLVVPNTAEASLTTPQNRDFKTALRKMISLAEQGHASAQYALGVKYHNGLGVPKDHKTALKWYSLAAEQGHASAQNNLGLLLLHGKGIQKDPSRALQLLKEAVRNGLKGGNAETTIGWSYFTGEHAPNIPKKFSKSLYWNKFGAQRGNTNAHSNLALHYFGGFGVEKNFLKMLYHLIKSAELFDENFKWVTDKPDEWIDFRHMASAKFWNARLIYWKAISTGKRSYINELLSLK